MNLSIKKIHTINKVSGSCVFPSLFGAGILEFIWNIEEQWKKTWKYWLLLYKH